MWGSNKSQLPAADAVLPGRAEPMAIVNRHAVHGRPIAGEFAGAETLVVGMGCFWGAERKFWSLPGVITTAVGYSAGGTPNPTYREVCSGLTGHNEVVKIVYDPTRIDVESLLKVFWESHDPTQGMRQGNDRGTQYRSGIYVTTDAQRAAAEASKNRYEQALRATGHAASITTEILDLNAFYYAEDDHQQYLHKNPAGYCGLGGTGVSCPVSRAAL
jgi:peptide-methionine (S)-S-oxide reductase